MIKVYYFIKVDTPNGHDYWGKNGELEDNSSLRKNWRHFHETESEFLMLHFSKQAFTTIQQANSAMDKIIETYENTNRLWTKIGIHIENDLEEEQLVKNIEISYSVYPLLQWIFRQSYSRFKMTCSIDTKPMTLLPVAKRIVPGTSIVWNVPFGDGVKAKIVITPQENTGAIAQFSLYKDNILIMSETVPNLIKIAYTWDFGNYHGKRYIVRIYPTSLFDSMFPMWDIVPTESVMQQDL